VLLKDIIYIFKDFLYSLAFCNEVLVFVICSSLFTACFVESCCNLYISVLVPSLQIDWHHRSLIVDLLMK
jgi:hypothetical protein